MEFLSELWMPILVSAALVWIASYFTHMVLPFHKGEWQGLPNEAATAAALEGAPPGNYMFPFGTMADMKNPEFAERQKRGPNGTVVIWDGPVDMGRNLILTLLAYVLIGVFVAYVARYGFSAGGSTARPAYLDIFRVVGAAAFLGHGMALIPHAIWYRGMRIWTVVLDALIYALLTAGVFGWLWPR